MLEFNDKEYRREKFNKKKRDNKKISSYQEENFAVTKKNQEFKQKKERLKIEDWEEDLDEIH